jgi:hypothetical protein
MNILELIRRDNEHFLDQFDRVDETGTARAKRGGSDSSSHPVRWRDPNDLDDGPLLNSFLVQGNSREVSLEGLDDRLALDQWLREIARG